MQYSKTTHYAPTITNPFNKQGGNNYGGSIDMSQFYQRLKDMRHQTEIADLPSTTQTETSFKEKLTPLTYFKKTNKYIDGHASNESNGDNTSRLYSMKEQYYSNSNDNPKYYGNVEYAYFSLNNGEDRDTKYYLTGGQFERTAYTYSIRSDKNYLAIINGNLTNSNSIRLVQNVERRREEKVVAGSVGKIANQNLASGHLPPF